MEEKITRELLEKSIDEHNRFISMICKNKYGHDNLKDVIEGVISYCDITDEKQRKLLRSGKFIPAGSILSACNTDTKGSFSNCYFNPIKKDSIEGIFEAQKEIARTFSYRGGIGTDITILRPKSAKVNNAAKTSSGAVSFMPSFSNLTKTICQDGRRGALLISMDIRHPDTLDFIWAKAKPEQVFEKDLFTGKIDNIDNANNTLKAPDSFMKAVEEDEDWIFCFPDFENQRQLYDDHWNGDYDEWFEIGGEFKEYGRIKARDLLNQIAEASCICGDPGLSFITTVQENTFGTYIHKSLRPLGYNACGEQPMGEYSNCLLGAFVLPMYVSGGFDMVDFEHDVEIATEIMNIFSNINVEKHPLQKQKEIDIFGKRIGCEITGFADTCAFLGYEYGDPNSCDLADEITDNMLYAQIRKSCDLSIQSGTCCPAMESKEAREAFVNNTWYDIYGDLKQDILDYGLFNTSFNTIGPCGTISIVSGNVTSGIEPLFKFSYTRKNRIDGNEYSFIHIPAAEHMLENLDEFEGLTLNQAKEKMNYLEADEIDWRKRIAVQSALQKNIDASISSTINLHNNTAPETIYEIYMESWRQGLKGVTVFRDGCKEGVLSENKQAMVGNECSVPEIFEKELLDEETAVRHRVSWKKSKLYVNLSVDEDNNPIEMFTKLPKEAGINGDGQFSLALFNERNSNWDLISRLISLCLRYGISLEHILEQLDKSSYSLVDAASIIKRILSKYVRQDIDDEEYSYQVCPECKESSYINEGGCMICKSCGYSKCG